MKVYAFALLTLIAAISAAAPRDNGDLADKIASTFAQLKEIIPEDSELKVTNTTTKIQSNSTNGEIHFNEYSISGLKESLHYHVLEDSTRTYAEYSLTFDNIVIFIDMDLNITGEITSHDHQVITINLQSLGFEGDLTFYNTDYKELSDLNVLLGLKASEITIEGVVNELFSQQLSADLSAGIPLIINQLADAYEKQLSQTLKKFINGIIL